jgi:hypothetical protein
MAIDQPIFLSGAVEGIVDEAVIRRLAGEASAVQLTLHGKSGKARLLRQIEGYNRAARLSPWIVLVDLDDDGDCAPPLRVAWLPHPAPQMCFRIAVRAVEAWLMADREHLARFLGVAVVRVPSDPEALEDPKQMMVDLARHSRRRAIREDMVPRHRSGRPVGPAYTSRMIEFAETLWHPEVAEQDADSLRRCRRRLLELIGKGP